MAHTALKICAFATLFLTLVVPVRAAELLMFEQRYCEYCERWNEEVGVVYHKTTEGKRAPLRRLDIHKTLPEDVAHVVTGAFTPTFVLMNKGEEIGRIRGYPGEDFFWGLLGQMLNRLPETTANDS